jgi:deoxycytidylate deaminase
MFITTGPCEMCAQLIIQNNISVVHILSLYRSETGVDLLRSGGVQVYRWKREEE